MSEQYLKPTRIDQYRLLLKQTGNMVTDATIFASEAIKLEPEAISQLHDAACLPPATKVLATADIHVGFGIPIGAVLGLQQAIMPAAVGYDINCGMRLMSTPFSKGKIDTDRVAASISRDVPLGEGKSNLMLDSTCIEAVITEGVGSIETLARRTKHKVWEVFDPHEIAEDLTKIEENGRLTADPAAIPKEAIEKGANQLGTLGGGNHFIEIQFVEEIFDNSLAQTFGLFENQIVIMIHTGSRRFGYEIADRYMNIAANEDRTSRKKMLSFLDCDSKSGKNYIASMAAAANFAFTNRQIIAMLVRQCFNRTFGYTPIKLVYDVAHNMAKLETHTGKQLWVHRKGATRAFGPERMKGTAFAHIGQPIITPGSMGTTSFLLVGTDYGDESLCSVNHGAGRTMSRTAALGKIHKGKTVTPPLISDDQFKQSMKGIKLITPDRHRIKEEAPQAYKDIVEVVRIVTECGWAKKVAKMHPLAVLKG